MINHEEWQKFVYFFWAITVGIPVLVSFFNFWLGWMKEVEFKDNFIFKFSYNLVGGDYKGEAYFFVPFFWIVSFPFISFFLASLTMRVIIDPMSYGIAASIIFLFIAFSKAGRAGFRVRKMLNKHVEDKEAHK